MKLIAPISGAVGDGAPNAPLDVAIVQDLLNRWADGRPKLPVDGIATPLLWARIGLFQTEVVGLRAPDRRVTPGSRTFELLQRMAGPAWTSPGAALPTGGLPLACLNREAMARGLRITFDTAALGLEGLLDGLCEDRELEDLRWGAYMLATAWHETRGTFMPVVEVGRGAGRDYGTPQSFTNRQGREVKNVYFGRGYVQLTWLENYLRLGQALGLGDALAVDPDRALDPGVAYRIMSCGMRDGLFTGQRLGSFIGPGGCDYLRARGVVNATDGALQIANVAMVIESLLRATAG
jgi:putative chitinase